MGKQPLSELKTRVYKLVDDWLELGDLDDRPIESESDFEQWVEKKIEAGTELSSFAEEVIDVLLGQFKGTDDLFKQVIAERDADKWDKGYNTGWEDGKRFEDIESGFTYPLPNPYRKEQNDG